MTSKYTPKHKVTGLTVSRDGSKFTAKWKVPASATSSKSESRFTGLLAMWRLDLAGVATKRDPTDKDSYGDEKRTQASETFGGMGRARSKLYPLGKRKAKRVVVKVRGYHSRSGKRYYGPWAGPAIYEFERPRKPSLSWAYDASSGNATVTVKTDAGDDARERHDTMARVVATLADGSEKVLSGWSASTKTEFKLTARLSPYLAALAPGKAVTVRCEAYSRGLAGDSATVTSSRSVGMPTAATLGAITCDRKAASGRVRVAVSPGKWTSSIQLQRKVGDGGWSNVDGAADDGDARCLFDSYGDIDPSPGERVWYRVVSKRDNYSATSAAKRADCVYTAAAKLSCQCEAYWPLAYTSKGSSSSSYTPVSKVSADGSAAAVTVMLAGADKPTGAQLWCVEDKAGWNSSDAPTRSASAPTSKSGGVYSGSKAFSLSGLEPGTTYHLRARPYREKSGEVAYGKLSPWASFRAEAAAASAACGIDEVVPTSDGTGARVVVGYSGDTSNTRTEIQWSDYRNAWTSNQAPESLKLDWGSSAYSGDGGWDRKQVCYLRGLEPGTTYYAKARRYSTTSSSASAWSTLVAFTTPSDASSSDGHLFGCGLVSVEAGDDGVSAKVVVGLSGDQAGAEVSWADDPDAWMSSEQPSSREFEWTDAESQSGEWPATATFYLRDLDEGATCYVRARAYRGSGDSRSWSGYTEAVAVTPVSAPASVALYQPDPVARGDAVELYWSVDGDIDQAEWHVHEAGSPNASLADGTGALCHASIPADRYGDAPSLSVYVEAGCGGGLTASNEVSVGIADAPSCEAACAPVLAAQPAAFEAYASDGSARLLATCRSLGATWHGPEGDRDQLVGDVVWTQALDPAWREAEWGSTLLRAQLEEAASAALDARDAAASALAAVEEGGEGYAEALAASQEAESALEGAQSALDAHPADGACLVADVELPAGLDLVDGGGYEVAVTAVEPVAGLASPEASCRFDVAWAHQAPDPTGAAVDWQHLFGQNREGLFPELHRAHVA